MYFGCTGKVHMRPCYVVESMDEESHQYRNLTEKISSPRIDKIVNLFKIVLTHLVRKGTNKERLDEESHGSPIPGPG